MLSSFLTMRAGALLKGTQGVAGPRVKKIVSEGRVNRQRLTLGVAQEERNPDLVS